MPLNNATGWRARGIAFCAGAVIGLAQAPFDFPWLLFLAIPVLFLLTSTNDTTRRRIWHGFGIGWWAGFGYFTLTLHWIVEPFLVDVARTGWMAPFALALKAGGHALFWGAAFGLARRMAPGPGIGAALALAGFWTLAEFGRSTIMTGFPWALIAYGWVETPILSAAAILGPHGLGAVTVFAALLPVVGGRVQLAGVAACVGLIFALVIGSTFSAPKSMATTTTVLRLVQPNAEQRLKWDPEWVPVFFNRMLAATQAPGNIDAVIWPEVAVPYLLDERLDLNRRIASAKPGATVIIGGRRVERGDMLTWYNSMAVLAPDGSLAGLYDKHHLVPFGEYLPFPALWDRFGLQALAQHGGKFSGGGGPVTMAINGLPPFQPLICYEMIFPHEIQRGADRPDWLLHLTNDAWFGSFSGPYQHLAQARFRAVEHGLPVVRVANTGISAVIDPMGEIVASIPLNSNSYMDSALPAPLPPTIYARFGDFPTFIALALMILGGIGLQRRAGRA